MTNLDSDIKNPFNVNKYNLLKVVSNTTGLTELDQFDVMFDLNEIVKDRYEKTVKGDLVAPFTFEYDLENSSISYILCDDFYKESFMYGLDKLGVKFEVIDITDDFLNLKSDIDRGTGDESEFDEFFELTEDFKMSHITFDKVFEKLADKGIQSLTKREKTFLDNYSI